MSGGHYDYLYYRMDELADNIQADINNDFLNSEEDRACGGNEFDYLDDVPDEEREKFVDEIIQMVKDLKKLSKKCRGFELFMSGDYGYDSLMEDWRENENNNS